MKYLIVAVIAICGFILLCFSLPAHADSICGPRADFVKALKDKYQESRRGIGVSGEAAIVEIYTSKAGTYTIIVTRPDGLSCIIAAGSGWEELPPPIEEKDT